MGVGKGQTARELARQTGRFAVDTDDLIESLTKKKIRKIFADQGEAAIPQNGTTGCRLVKAFCQQHDSIYRWWFFYGKKDP